MRHPYISPTIRSGPTPQSPKRFILSPPHQSSKRNRAMALTTSTVIPLLGALIIFSSITNLHSLGGGGGGGVDREAASWDQVPPRDGEQKQLVRRDKTTRRKTMAVRGVLNDRPLVNSRTGGNDDSQNRKGQSFWRETATNGYSQQINLNNEDSRQPVSFTPHPTMRARQSSSFSHLLLPPPTASIKINRLVCLDGKHVITQNNVDAHLENWLGEDHSDGIVVGKSSSDELAYRTQTVVWDHEDECVPMSAWQSNIHPTCNSLHEVDISQLINAGAFSLVSSRGFWRNAWKVDVVERAEGIETADSSQDQQFPPGFLGRTEDNGESVNTHVVLKSIKYIHEPNKEVFELSRVDAISLDVLTKSRFTINIYGFCGSSSLQEFAGGDLKGLLPVLDPIDKLRMATWLANGIADIHAVDSWNSVSYFDEGAHAVHSLTGSADIDAEAATEDNDGYNRSATPVSLIHNDINMDNILLGYRNRVETPLINDFNIAVFQKRNKQTGLPCQFHGRFANPQWMSPEQQERDEDELSTGKLNEKIDIYALGNILYKIAVGNSPWKYDYKVNRITEKEKKSIARAKLKGRKPKVPPELRNSTSPIKAVLTAMNKCYRNEARLRPSARELAAYLQSELDAIELPLKVMDRFEFDE